ncbi:unnamed protein product [Cladocopium goreaui]|nr:unnamed protein product [Cladocopium goreaui]
MRLREVKELIRQQLQVPAGQQRLLFRGRDLTKTADEPDPRWGSLGVPFGEALQLVIVMYETGPASAPSVRSLKFDLTWTAIPTRLRNGKVTTHHLNGSCLVLDRNGRQAVDFQQRSYPGILHGGHSSIRSPKQSLTVDTAALPPDVRYLFFTLSGFAPGGVTLAVFQDPSVHLRDGVTKATLQSYTASGGGRNEEALVLCCAAKDPTDGRWTVQRVGAPSSGNKSNYDPLYVTVNSLVRNGKVV